MKPTCRNCGSNEWEYHVEPIWMINGSPFGHVGTPQCKKCNSENLEWPK